MKNLFLAAMITIGLIGCTAEDRSRTVLENEGFGDIVFTGYDWWSCDDYNFRTGFEATNSRGHHVEGTVCCHFTTDCSIHW